MTRLGHDRNSLPEFPPRPLNLIDKDPAMPDNYENNCNVMYKYKFNFIL